MGTSVTFFNPQIPHYGENVFPDWDFKDAVEFHKKLVRSSLFFKQNKECAIFGTKRSARRMDCDKPHWILEEV